MNLKDELFSAADALQKAEIDYALCGGMAVAKVESGGRACPRGVLPLRLGQEAAPIAFSLG